MKRTGKSQTKKSISGSLSQLGKSNLPLTTVIIIIGLALAGVLALVRVLQGPLQLESAAAPKGGGGKFANTISVVPQDRRVAPGTTSSVDLDINTLYPVAAFELTMSYDPSLLEVSSVVIGPFLSSTGRTATLAGPQIDNVAGKVTFGGYTFGTQLEASGKGTLATVNILTKQSGTSALSLVDTVATDTKDTLYQLSPVDGKITVTR